MLNRDIAVIFREQFPLDNAMRDLIEAVTLAGLAVGDGLPLPKETGSSGSPSMARQAADAPKSRRSQKPKLGAEA
jgi:hypothetical protein